MSQLSCCHLFFRIVYSSLLGAGSLLLFIAGNVNAAEWSLNSNIQARYEYNDNIFLTLQPHESVSNVVIQPDIKFRAEEKNWVTMLEARLRSNNYSDSNLDSHNQHYLADGSYKRERDTYSIKGSYDLNSSLDIESNDFGLSRVRVNRTTTNISPSYSRMLTERLLVSLGYTIMESKYDDSVSTDFVSYEAEIASASLAYNLSERDKFNTSVQYTDYMSLNGLSEYQLLTSRMGLSRNFAENFTADFQIGTSVRDAINRSTSTIDFFGTTISLVQESVSSNRGYVLDAGFVYKSDEWAFSGRLGRDNVTNSYGGVNEADTLKFDYNRRLTDRWGYGLIGKYEKTEAIISSISFSDSRSLTVNASINYALAMDWKITASWRYLEREFTTQNQTNVPRSNTIYLGMTYNFSEVSTF